MKHVHVYSIFTFILLLIFAMVLFIIVKSGGMPVKVCGLNKENLGHLNIFSNIIHFLDICIPSIIPKKGFLGGS